MEQKPFVSIIIPCRNEENFIGKCLDSLIANDYPKDRLEIIVVNGASTDKTKGVVEEYIKKHDLIRLFDNPKKTTPISMNIGIKAARGDIITKTDAHSIYQPDYISKSVRYLEEYDADLVGGVQKATPKNGTLEAKAIILSLASFLGAGNAPLRRGAKKPVEVDTVFGGFFKKEVFEKAGMFNEKLTRSQDMDLGIRMKNKGMKIILIPEIEIEYHPKPTIIEFLKHNFKDGIWAILPLKYGAPMFKIRHLLPMLFVIILSGLFFLSFVSIIARILFDLTMMGYILGITFESVRISLKEKNIALFPYLISAFIVRHFGYGFGSIIGAIKLILPEK